MHLNRKITTNTRENMVSIMVDSALTEHKCELCEKVYKKESTLAKHKCKYADRWNEKGNVYFRFAFIAFNLFYSWSYKRSKPKTEIEFIKSQYYKEFYKFGEYMASVKINDIKKYTAYLLYRNVPLKYWTDEKIYNMYLANIIKTEPVDDAVERTIHTMERWAEDNNSKIQNYFTNAEPQVIFTQIKRGNLSPWVLYNTTSGKRFFKRLTPLHIEMLVDLIDPEYWSHTFETKKVEVNAVTTVLKSVGL